MSRAKKTPPVTVRSRRTACENERWTVYLDDVLGSNGESVSDYLVVAPKFRAPELISGVCVLPLIDGQIGLVRMYRHAMQDFGWEAARGFIDEGENAPQAALRELTEETGLVCSIDALLPLGFLAQEPSTLEARVALFCATACHSHPSAEVEEELGLTEFRLFEVDDVLEMCGRSEIVDASTLTAIYKYLFAVRTGSSN